MIFLHRVNHILLHSFVVLFSVNLNTQEKDKLSVLWRKIKAEEDEINIWNIHGRIANLNLKAKEIYIKNAAKRDKWILDLFILLK